MVYTGTTQHCSASAFCEPRYTGWSKSSRSLQNCEATYLDIIHYANTAYSVVIYADNYLRYLRRQTNDEMCDVNSGLYVCLFVFCLSVLT